MAFKVNESNVNTTKLAAKSQRENSEIQLDILWQKNVAECDFYLQWKLNTEHIYVNHKREI